jgi:hypothetical protein
VRTTLIAAAALVFSVACADAPITAADLQADGQLRQTSAQQQQSIHAASESHQPKAQQAERLRVTGLLAAQAEGPLEDATRFSLDSEGIYLHLRADDLSEPRPVTYVWSHHGQGHDHERETMGFLQPAATIGLAASFPLARYLTGELGAEPGAELGADAQPPIPLTLVGEWRVEVYSADANGRNLLFERDFVITELSDESMEAAN